jgi:hypothetical protein
MITILQVSGKGDIMQETDRMADELERATEGEAWHGPAFKQSLAGVTATEAGARPIPGVHTIWEIVLHMTAWTDEVERRLRENVRPLSAEADWPTPQAGDESAWSEATTALTDAHRRLRQTIREFPPSRLDEHLAGQADEPAATSFYVMLHGLAQHDAYHTGQLAILRKAIAGGAD